MIANYRQAVQVGEPEPEINFVEYIQSTGIQYIDTGFMPDNNTRVIVDIQVTKAGTYGIFGGRQNWQSRMYAFWITAEDEWKSDFGNRELRVSVGTTLERIVIDKNKNVFHIGSSSYTNTNTSFDSPSSLTLFTVKNSDGVDDRMGSLKLYSCQIYDNEVLIRDYAPALDPDGVPCLYEKLSEQYVYNAGTGSFISSTGEVDEHTLLLLHGEAFEDSSMYRRTVGDFGATISTAQKKFGSSSFYFNGNSKLLISSSIDFKSNDFTVDWWEYCTASSNGTRFSSPWTSTSDLDGGFLIGYHGTSVFAKTGPSAGSWNLVSNAPLVSVTTSQWVHWAIVRNGNTFISFRNGVRYSSVSINSGNIHYDPSNPMAVGGYRQFDTDYFSGYIDEFRISDVARWTTNFTPPTAPYES